MRSVGLKVLKNKLSEYVRIAAKGELVLICDRDKIVAELSAPQAQRAEHVSDAHLASLIRQGYISPALIGRGRPQAAQAVTSLEELLTALKHDREDR